MPFITDVGLHSKRFIHKNKLYLFPIENKARVFTFYALDLESKKITPYTISNETILERKPGKLSDVFIFS